MKILALVLLASLAHAADKKEAVLVRPTIESIQDADPVLDAKLAIKQKDFRLAAIYGYSLTVPGLKNTGLAYEHPEKVWIIEGTSDNKQTELNHLAAKYAETYNGIILKYVKKLKKGGS